MKKSIPVTILILVVSLFIPISSGWGQRKPSPVVQQKFSVPALSVFIAGSYFGQKFADVNAVYSTLESNLSLPAGSDFRNYYSVLAGIRFSPNNTQSVQGEFGGSVMKAVKDKSINYLQMYYAGGSYILSLPLQMVSVYGGGGLGYVWLNTQRTYTTRLGVAAVNAQLAQLHALFGLQFFEPSGVSFSLEGRYNYATTVWPQRADLNFTMKGISAGIQIGVPINM